MSQAHAVHSFGTFDTDIVVDLGCCSYERNGRLEDSIQTLIKRFRPRILFGFDPHPGLPDRVDQVYGTTVITSRRAAWTEDISVPLELQGNCTHVTLTGEHFVWGFDLAAWVRQLPDVNIVLKVDVEGAEYVLLPHLISHGLMDRFSHLLVEWHTEPYANGLEADRASILEGIECPVETWQ